MRESHCRNLPCPCQRQSAGFAKEHHRGGGTRAPQRGLRTGSLRKRALWRQKDATAKVFDGIPYETRLVASKRRRSEVLPRDCGAQHREPRRDKKAAPCGYDYEPTFIRWVSSPSVPASPTTEDPLPGRNVGLPSNACRFTQFVPQGDDTSNVGEHASQHQS